MKSPLLRGGIVLVLCATGVLLSASANAAIYRHLGLPINGAQETPPNGSPAIGTADVYLDTGIHRLEWKVTFSGLTAAQTAAHFHGPAAPGVPAGIMFPIAVGSPSVGTRFLTGAEEAIILSGNSYINVHTTAFPSGEIRGQVVPTAFPGISPWGMALLALLLVGAGTAVIAMRRRAGRVA